MDDRERLWKESLPPGYLDDMEKRSKTGFIPAQPSDTRPEDLALAPEEEVTAPTPEQAYPEAVEPEAGYEEPDPDPVPPGTAALIAPTKENKVVGRHRVKSEVARPIRGENFWSAVGGIGLGGGLATILAVFDRLNQ